MVMFYITKCNLTLYFWYNVCLVRKNAFVDDLLISVLNYFNLLIFVYDYIYITFLKDD